MELTSFNYGWQTSRWYSHVLWHETDVERLKTLNTDVLAVFANKDAWITPKVAADFQANMTKAGKKLTLKQYDADHAFANPSNPVYNSVAAADAYAATLSFLMPRLK
jgi:carboxymethylenebutenolidase